MSKKIPSESKEVLPVSKKIPSESKEVLPVSKKIPLNDFLHHITVVYVVLMIAANVMASKVLTVGGLIIDAGTLTYPLTFMIGDILAELFGYKAARRVILWGFGANLGFCLCALAGAGMPPLDPGEPLTAAYNTLFTYNIRILGASFVAYIAGALLNAGTLLVIRRLTGPKWLALRTIGSTALGAAADTALFVVLAWAFVLPWGDLFIMGVSGYGVKMAYEILIATPLDYFFIPVIKKFILLPKDFSPAPAESDSAP